MNRFFLALLLCTPLALISAYTHFSPVFTFFLSAVAIIPLAKYIGDATQEITSHTNAGIGGFLNASFGNAPELIICIFALNAGLLEVVKASIIGSVLGNLLLVLGTSILAGGWNRERQKFNATAAKASCSMLLLAVLALVVPAIFQATSPTTSPAVLLWLSLIVSVLMIFAYVAQLLFSLRTHKHLYVSESDTGTPTWTMGQSLTVLAVATIAVACVSHALIGSIMTVVTYFGWTQIFIGVVIIAIVSNAAEHVSAIQAAVRNQMDLTFAITIGSATQVVLFVAPVLVLISFAIGHPMNLVFNLFELVAFIFAVFVTNAIIEDGETNWLEGVQLLVAYGILGVAFFLHV